MREKTKAKNLSESFPPARLFLDDIEKIIEAFKEISDTTVSLENEVAYFENAEDLKNLKSEFITSLTINSAKPYVSLDFEPDGIRFYAAEDTLLSRGLLDKVRTILRPRQHIYLNKKCQGFFAFITGILGGLSLILIFYGIRKFNYLILFFSAILFLIAYLFAKFDYDLFYKKYSIIFLYKKSDKISFWKRNREQITIEIIIGIVLLVLALLADQGFKIVSQGSG